MPAHGGFLCKLSGGCSSSTRSRELYFELQGMYLYYYNRRPIYETEPLGEIDLHESSVCEDLLLEDAFVLTAPAMRASYRLAARNQTDKEDWMFEIRACSGDTPSNRRLSSHRGSTTSSGSSQMPSVTMTDFETIRVLGEGSFGKVRLSRRRSTGEVYAIKSMSKREILHQGILQPIKGEREVLSQLRHPFIVHLHFAFHDATQLHLVMDYLSGGELFQHMSEACFSESRARFYAAQVVLALSHIHSLGIIYRDLKPENLVLDSKGNCCLTDFGLAKKAKLGLSFVGTAAYIAPEFLIGEPHDCRADYWSLGILIFEMVIGIPPFFDDDMPQMYEKILGATLDFRPEAGEDVTVSEEMKCLCGGLLSRDMETRLSGKETLDHPWFTGIDAAALLRGELEAPFVPPPVPAIEEAAAEEECMSRCESLGESMSSLPPQRRQGSFSGYSYAGSWIADELQSQTSTFDLTA